MGRAAAGDQEMAGGWDAGEGGRNGNGKGQTSGESGTETRMTTASKKRTVEQVRGGRGKDMQRDQVSSDGARGEYRTSGAGQEESVDESAEWSGAELEGSATEEEATTTGGQSGKERSGRRRCEGLRTAARESNLETRWPTGATPGKPPPQPPTRRERGAAMGRGRQTGGGLEASGKTRRANPRECGAMTGSVSPP